MSTVTYTPNNREKVTFNVSGSATRNSNGQIHVNFNMILSSDYGKKGAAYYGCGQIKQSGGSWNYSTRISHTSTSNNGQGWRVPQGSGTNSWGEDRDIDYGARTYVYNVRAGGYGAQGESSTQGYGTADNITITISAKKSNLSFDSNYSGGPSIPSIEVSYGSTYDDLPILTRTGYDFIGWFTEDNVKIENGQTVSIITDTILYAHWEIKTLFHLIQNGRETIAPMCFIKDGSNTSQAIGLCVKEGNNVYQCI